MMFVYLACVFCALTATVQAECKIGYTGPWCETKCSDGCVGGVCSLHKHGGIVCSRGCKDGWAGESCRTPCAEHCKRCNRTQSKDCEECKHFYFGQTCSQKCMTCGPAGCDKDGMCRNRPANCDGGVICGKTCIKKCRFCNTDATAAATCSVCQRNYAGDNCKIPCDNCRGTCTQSGCSDGCLCGYYGLFCRDRCSSTCLESCNSNSWSSNDMCARSNGSCLNGCKDGHFGQRCQHRCNANCKTCEQTSGHCTGACKDGHYGESCEHDCFHCKHGKCKKDGLCYKCRDGYHGANCKTPCDPICTSCGRYNGLCETENQISDDGGSAPLIQLPFAIVPTQSQRAATNGLDGGSAPLIQLPFTIVPTQSQRAATNGLDGGSAPLIQLPFTIVPTQSQRAATNGPEIKSADTKSEDSRGLPSFVIWLCVAFGVLTVISLATIAICCHRARNKRRKNNTALLTRSISHRNNYIPELPSPVRTNVPGYDYDEIPELSDETAGRSQGYGDESQNVVRVGVAHSAVDTDNLGGAWMRDRVRKGKDVKYLSVTDVVSSEGYIDVIG
ncbi:cell death abnormality protein 1-like isoform X2 [Haliotis asinina]|uniref:cell death abnormality protein 1-like isoform X2 n=1 Tax=Haliotis asinina TaxID=109174 RepID=UPI003531F16C